MLARLVSGGNGSNASSGPRSANSRGSERSTWAGKSTRALVGNARPSPKRDQRGRLARAGGPSHASSGWHSPAGDSPGSGAGSPVQALPGNVSTCYRAESGRLFARGPSAGLGGRGWREDLSASSDDDVLHFRVDGTHMTELGMPHHHPVSASAFAVRESEAGLDALDRSYTPGSASRDGSVAHHLSTSKAGSAASESSSLGSSSDASEDEEYFASLFGSPHWRPDWEWVEANELAVDSQAGGHLPSEQPAWGEEAGSQIEPPTPRARGGRRLSIVAQRALRKLHDVAKPTYRASLATPSPQAAAGCGASPAHASAHGPSPAERATGSSPAMPGHIRSMTEPPLASLASYRGSALLGDSMPGSGSVEVDDAFVLRLAVPSSLPVTLLNGARIIPRDIRQLLPRTGTEHLPAALIGRLDDGRLVVINRLAQPVSVRLFGYDDPQHEYTAHELRTLLRMREAADTRYEIEAVRIAAGVPCCGRWCADCAARTTKSNSDTYTLLHLPGRIRSGFRRLLQWPWFDRVVLVAILVNCVFLALDEPGVQHDAARMHMLDVAEVFFAVFFTLEMVVKMVAQGLNYSNEYSYFRSMFNCLDFLIVLEGLASVSGLFAAGRLTALRAIRAIRPLRSVTRLKGLRVLVNSLIHSVPLLGQTLVVLALYLLVFGIVGMEFFKGVQHNLCVPNHELWAAGMAAPAPSHAVSWAVLLDMNTRAAEPDRPCGGGYGCAQLESCVNMADVSLAKSSLSDTGTSMLVPAPNSSVSPIHVLLPDTSDAPRELSPTVGFDDVPIAVLSLFQALTLEGWSNMMYDTMDGFHPTAWLFWLVCTLLGALLLMNLTLAVITTKVAEAQDLVRKERLRALALQRAQKRARAEFARSLSEQNAKRNKEEKRKRRYMRAVSR